MPAILGLRGTGQFTSDERPQNWREMIMLLFPNGEAPLTAVLSLLKSRPTDDPSYNWWEKRLPTQRFALNGSHAGSVTVLTVDSGAKDTVAGTILLHENSGELIKVLTDPTSDTSIPDVVRSYGAVAAGTLADDDFLVVVGNVHEQGADPPTARSYAPTKVTNVTEIFRTALSLTRTAKKTRLRWDASGPYREAKREALSLHSIEMEKAFIWGEKIEGTGVTGMPENMTGGVLSFLTTNIGATNGFGSKAAPIGLLDEDTLDTMMEGIFRFGSTEKLALCGSTFLRALTTIAKRNSQIERVPTDQTYGMKIMEYISTSGTLMLKNHPLFSQHPVWRQNALILDVPNLGYRYIDDTMFIKNRQNPGQDLSKDEFLTEGGLELEFEESHGYIQGVTGGLAA